MPATPRLPLRRHPPAAASGPASSRQLARRQLQAPPLNDPYVPRPGMPAGSWPEATTPLCSTPLPSSSTCAPGCGTPHPRPPCCPARKALAGSSGEQPAAQRGEAFGDAAALLMLGAGCQPRQPACAAPQLARKAASGPAVQAAHEPASTCFPSGLVLQVPHLLQLHTADGAADGVLPGACVQSAPRRCHAAACQAPS